MSGWPVSSSIPADLLDRAGRDAPDLILAVGNFADDVAIVRHRDRLPASTRLAVVTAGLDAFAREAGAAAEGVIGASQWGPDNAESPRIGPASDWFWAEYRRAFQRLPSYIAAQSYAMGIIVGECARRTKRFVDAAHHDRYSAPLRWRPRRCARSGTACASSNGDAVARSPCVLDAGGARRALPHAGESIPEEGTLWPSDYRSR
jgi:hypothetical protein